MKLDAGTSLTGLKMADEALYVTSTSLPAGTAVTLAVTPDHTRYPSFPRIILIERLLDIFLLFLKKILLGKNKYIKT